VVHHWLKSRSTREERKPVTRNDDDNNNNNNNNRKLVKTKMMADSFMQV
jgi:hypothetical protein